MQFKRLSEAQSVSSAGMPLERAQELLGTCREELFKVRAQRPRPALDDKVCTHLCVDRGAACVYMHSSFACVLAEGVCGGGWGGVGGQVGRGGYVCVDRWTACVHMHAD